MVWRATQFRKESKMEPNSRYATSDGTVSRSNHDATKMVIAESSRLNAEAVSWCLSAYGNFQNVESTFSTEELLSAIRTQRPAIVVIGEKIASEGIREIVAELAVKMGETRVAVFADEMTDRQLDLVASNGVTAFLSRNESMRNLNEQLLRAAAGTSVLSGHLSSRLELNGKKFRCLASRHLRRLTDRQWDVLLRIAAGGRVSQVAADLEITPKAVESHKYRIMKTVGATDRVGLCRWAIREGLIEA